MYEKWFAGYTAQICSRISGASLIEADLKTEHSYLVRDRCREIAQSLNLPERDIELATVIGLFHDLGRFRQALNFGTMDDRITGPHGEMSADVFREEAPKDGLSDEEIEIIDCALRYHNVFRLPQSLSGRPLLFTQIARDGDKLDIFRFYTDKKESRGFRFIMSEEPGECSPEMLEGALNGENLRVSGIRNASDRKLMQVSLVYDLNFGYSFEWMLKKDYLAVITGVSDGTADTAMHRVYDYATSWIKKKLQELA